MQNGDSSLHIAAAMGRRKLTRILLEAGADQHTTNKVTNSTYNSPCGTSPKRTLHQVYELLLIEMELIHRNRNIPNKESYSQI